jgi:hypothetical protein
MEEFKKKKNSFNTIYASSLLEYAPNSLQMRTVKQWWEGRQGDLSPHNDGQNST